MSKEMKRSFALAVGIILSFAITTTAVTAEPLRVGIGAEPYPPFSSKTADGNWTGFEIELADAICEQLGRKCITTPTAWNGIIPSLTTGKIDIIINSLTITEKRERVVDFSRPYYKSGTAFVAPKDADIQIPDGLDGKTIGVQSATTNAKYVRTHFSDTGVKIKYYPTQADVDRDLLAHRIDLMAADAVLMSQFVQTDSASNYEIKKIIKTDSLGIGAALRPSDDKLRKSINTAITAIIENGTCKSLSMQYFGMDICVEDYKEK